MKGVRTTILVAMLSIAALPGEPSPVYAKDAQATGPRDSVVPIVDPAAYGYAERAERTESDATAADAVPAFDVVDDNPAELWAALADVPLAAWLLLGTCVLCMRFAPRSLERFEGDRSESAPADVDYARSPGEATLVRPRRSPG